MSFNVDPGICWLFNVWPSWSTKKMLSMSVLIEDAEAVPGGHANTNGALFYHVGAVCGVGLPCPPYVANRPITCVVCTI